MKKLLALDLSTVSSGYAIWNMETKKLLKYDVIKPNIPRPKSIIERSSLTHKLNKLKSIAAQIKVLIEAAKVDVIVIEEINRGKNRLGQKTLDGFHYIVQMTIQDHLHKVGYIDSDGPTGWRTTLNLRLSPNDKTLNKSARAFNKKRIKGIKKQPLVTKKTLAANYVNKAYKTQFDVDKQASDSDICDAIGLGHAFLLTSK